MALITECLSQSFSHRTRPAIDDARLTSTCGGVAEDLLARLIFHLEGEAEVGAVEPAKEHLGRVAIE